MLSTLSAGSLKNDNFKKLQMGFEKIWKSSKVHYMPL